MSPEKDVNSVASHSTVHQFWDRTEGKRENSARRPVKTRCCIRVPRVLHGLEKHQTGQCLTFIPHKQTRLRILPECLRRCDMREARGIMNSCLPAGKIPGIFITCYHRLLCRGSIQQELYTVKSTVPCLMVDSESLNPTSAIASREKPVF